MDLGIHDRNALLCGRFLRNGCLGRRAAQVRRRQCCLLSECGKRKKDTGKEERCVQRFHGAPILIAT